MRPATDGTFRVRTAPSQTGRFPPWGLGAHFRGSSPTRQGPGLLEEVRSGPLSRLHLPDKYPRQEKPGFLQGGKGLLLSRKEVRPSAHLRQGGETAARTVRGCWVQPQDPPTGSGFTSPLATAAHGTPAVREGSGSFVAVPELLREQVTWSSQRHLQPTALGLGCVGPSQFTEAADGRGQEDQH